MKFPSQLVFFPEQGMRIQYIQRKMVLAYSYGERERSRRELFPYESFICRKHLLRSSFFRGGVLSQSVMRQCLRSENPLSRNISVKKVRTLIPAVVVRVIQTFSFALRSASCFMVASLSPRTTFSAKASARLQIEDTTLRACLPLARPWILAAAKSNPCSASAVWCQADRVIYARMGHFKQNTPSGFGLQVFSFVDLLLRQENLFVVELRVFIGKCVSPQHGPTTYPVVFSFRSLRI